MEEKNKWKEQMERRKINKNKRTHHPEEKNMHRSGMHSFIQQYL